MKSWRWLWWTLLSLMLSLTAAGQANTYPLLHIYLLTDEMPAPDGPESRVAQEVRRVMADFPELEYRLHYVSWPKALAEVAKKPDALVVNLLRTPAREPHYSWLVPGPPVQLHLYTLAEQPLRSHSLVALQQQPQLRIACPAQSAHCEMLLHVGFRPEQVMPVRLTEQDSVERLLLARRVDFIAAAGEDVERRMRLLGVEPAAYVQAQQVAELTDYLAGGPLLDPAVKALFLQRQQVAKPAH